MSLKAMDIARYFLHLTDIEEGDLISNLKLQKLLYYAQGFYLALYDKPLFSEKIKAWQHGPVVPEIYHEFKSCGSGAISPPKDFNRKKYPQKIQNFLDEVHEAYGQFSAWKLAEMTHGEPPFKNAIEQHKEIISEKDMKEYFKTQIVYD